MRDKLALLCLLYLGESPEKTKTEPFSRSVFCLFLYVVVSRVS